MSPRFYVAKPLSAAMIGTTIDLPDAVAHHVVRVLRLPAGAQVVLFDGTGGEYRATLLDIGSRPARAVLQYHDAVDRESPLQVTLVQSIIATDAMDFAVRKSVELGVAAIEPVIAARSQFALAGGRGDKRLAHWRAIAIAACEQCGRNRVPPIAAPQPMNDWLRTQRVSVAVMASPSAKVALAAFARTNCPAAVVIGPEGGFTDAERALAVESGVVEVHLGPRVLRAETAGVAALAMLAAVVGDAG